MSELHFPAGISVKQAKKDAKKLSKTSEIPLHQSQDIISFKHSRMKWHDALNAISTAKPESILLHTQSGKEKVIDIGVKSLNIVYSKSGSGKSTLANIIAEQMLVNNKVTYLNVKNGMCKAMEKSFKDEYGDKISFIYFDYNFITKTIDIDLKSLELNGSVLIIDEFARLHCEENDNLVGLIRASSHCFIFTQLITSHFISDLMSKYEDTDLRMFFSSFVYSLDDLKRIDLIKENFGAIMESIPKLTVNQSGVDFLMIDCDGTQKIKVNSNTIRELRINL